MSVIHRRLPQERSLQAGIYTPNADERALKRSGFSNAVLQGHAKRKRISPLVRANGVRLTVVRRSPNTTDRRGTTYSPSKNVR